MSLLLACGLVAEGGVDQCGLEILVNQTVSFYYIMSNLNIDYINMSFSIFMVSLPYKREPTLSIIMTSHVKIYFGAASAF